MANRHIPKGSPVLVGVNRIPGHVFWCRENQTEVFVVTERGLRSWSMHRDDLIRAEGPVLPKEIITSMYRATSPAWGN